MAVIDGNHRLVAKALKGEKVSAMVVDMDAAFADALKLKAKDPAMGIGMAIMKAADKKK